MASVADQNQPTKKPTLATDQEEEHQDLDFISHLPDEILHNIISKLQIHNAAVTTAVSKRWGPIFPTLPSLNIFAGSFDPFVPRYNQYVRNRIKWVDALCSVLNSRKSAVKKFDIAVALKPDNDDFYEVIRDVCIAGVEELSIKNTSSHSCYETPLSVFNSNTIVKLNICYCTLEVPSKLTGLQSLKSLGLTNVTVADDDLQRMISWCKAMENLSIIDCFKVKNIVICAPSLSELVIRLVWPVVVVLKSVPRLVSVLISFNYSSDAWMKCDGCLLEKGAADEESHGGFSLSNSEKTFEGTNEATNLVDFLNNLSRVKDLRLNFNDDYRMILSKDGMALPTSLSPNCYLVELKKLCLCLPMNYDTFNMVISCLLNSSPYLMEIIICVETSMYHNIRYKPNALELNFWEKQLPAECVKHHLTTATIFLDYYLPENCLVFPKFLLRNAGNLKNMNVYYTKRPYNKFIFIAMDIREKMEMELFVIENASPDVEITVKPIISRQKYVPSF